MNICLNTKGYPHVTLYKDGTRHNFRTHRLVAETFIPNLDNLPEVNHKDGVKTNNAETNLEWVTGGQNMRHSFDVLGRQGLKGGRNGANKLTELQVLDIWRRKDTASRKALAREYGITATGVYNIHMQINWKWLTDGV